MSQNIAHNCGHTDPRTTLALQVQYEGCELIKELVKFDVVAPSLLAGLIAALKPPNTGAPSARAPPFVHIHTRAGVALARRLEASRPWTAAQLDLYHGMQLGRCWFDSNIAHRGGCERGRRNDTICGVQSGRGPLLSPGCCSQGPRVDASERGERK